MSLTRDDIREMVEEEVGSGPWDEGSIKKWMWLSGNDAGLDVTEAWVIVCPT